MQIYLNFIGNGLRVLKRITAHMKNEFVSLLLLGNSAGRV